MKKFLKITTLMAAVLTPSLGFSQESSSIDVSAKIDPGCFIEADNVNFGNLNMPLSNQTSMSNMRIQCSKGANISIAIYYSSNGDIGTKNTGTYTNVFVNNSNNNNDYTSYETNQTGFTAGKIYNDSTPISNAIKDYECIHNHNGYYNQIYVYSIEFASLYKINVGFNDSRVNNVCNGTLLNLDTLSSFGTPAKGVLKGVQKSEKIIYSVEKPDSPSTVWNSSNVYSITPTGVTQNIPMKVNILSADNPKYRMSPDMYQDNLTIALTY